MTDVESLKALIRAARADNARLDAERHRLEHEGQALAGEVDRLTAQNERIDHIIAVLRCSQFGRSSERISVEAELRSDDDQFNLALEDVETGHGVNDAKAEKANDIVRREGIKGRRTNRGKLPEHLPREEIVIEPKSTACPCCGEAVRRRDTLPGARSGTRKNQDGLSLGGRARRPAVGRQ